jgi:hypothetical protein
MIVHTNASVHPWTVAMDNVSNIDSPEDLSQRRLTGLA